MAFTSLILSFVVCALVYKTVSALVSKKLRRTFSAVDDVPFLGISRKEGNKITGTAVVCGGSIAGLLSARVCADHFENVIIVEPEEWITTAEGMDTLYRTQQSSMAFHKRSRVFQYSSLHGVQSFLTVALQGLFPNFEREIVKVGARLVTADANVHWSGVPIKAPWHQYRSNMFPTVSNLRRAGLETTLRRLVIATCPNVRYMTGAVTALGKTDSSADAVDSVRVRSPGGKESSLSATLVIDCTGPALGGLRWLHDLSPTSSKATSKSSLLPLESLKETYDAKMAYSTCEFDIPARLLPSLNALDFPEDFETASFLHVSFPDPKLDNRNLLIGRREYNFIQFACGGWDVHERLTSVGDIKNFLSKMRLARPLPEWIYQMLDLFEEEHVPLTCVHVRCPPSVYVQYHLAEQLPSNFIAIGDSVLQLNPIRGHGCTKACVDAVSLNGLLSGRGAKGTGDSLPKDFSRKFFDLQAKRTGRLWNTYKAEDYAWETTTPAKGDDRSFGSWQRAYGSAVMRLDREVSAVWWHAANWMAPATDLFSPIIILKLARMQLQGYLGI